MKRTILISVLVFSFVFPDPANASPVREPQIYTDGIIHSVPTFREPAQSLKQIEPKSIEPMELKVPTLTLQQSSIHNSNRFVWGWCTYFAQSQRMDKQFSGNATDWIRFSNGTSPKIGAVAVNTYVAGGLGHVAIVVDISGDKVLVRHMNYKGFGVISEDWTPLSYWSGYIY